MIKVANGNTSTVEAQSLGFFTFKFCFSKPQKTSLAAEPIFQHLFFQNMKKATAMFMTHVLQVLS